MTRRNLVGFITWLFSALKQDREVREDTLIHKNFGEMCSHIVKRFQMVIALIQISHFQKLWVQRTQKWSKIEINNINCITARFLDFFFHFFVNLHTSIYYQVHRCDLSEPFIHWYSWWIAVMLSVEEFRSKQISVAEYVELNWWELVNKGVYK